MRNSEVRLNEFPLFSFSLLKTFFISLFNLFICWFTIILSRDEINKILWVGININPMAVLVQFNGRWLISVVGSNIVNRFLVTFNLFC